MASSAAEPPPPPPPPPGGGEGSASTRSRSTPVAVEFVYPSGVPPLPVSLGEDWESEGSNAWIPSGIDPALAFRLVVRLDSSFTRDSKRSTNGFNFPAVIATTILLRNLKANICDKYPRSPREAVHFEYFNSTERRFVPLISDDDLGILFALNASCRFGKIRIHVDRGQTSSGVGASSGGRASCLSTAAASANSVRRPCRSTAAPSVPSASGSQIVPVVNVEDDAEIGDQSPEDDEDELMFPELVDRCSKQAMEDQYMEDIAFGARFDETDDEEKNENDDSLVLADYEGEDLPTIEWNREDPQLAKGTVFQTMMDCRNAITTYHILTKNNYEIKNNKEIHRCPPLGGEPDLKTKLAKTRWLADIILDWLRETPSLGPTALQKKVAEKYKGMKVPYMRMFYAKINGPWNESFQLLYTFKAEVEMASPGSVVAIDKHTVPYKLKSGKVMHKECFRRAFVCFKACWKGFLDGCRPYLAVDASALHGRFKGQLVAATAVDGHNWMFPVAYGVLEVESEESWTWFLQNLRDLIGHPPGLVIHTDACKGLESAVEAVFPGVEHRECMRHLVQNFTEKFKGKVFSDNLWPASYTCSSRKHMFHLDVLYKQKPGVKEYLDEHHGRVWSRSQFNEICKVDYVTSNLAESFNSKVKSLKGLMMWQIFDKIRQMIMIKIDLRQRIASTKYAGHLMLPSLIKSLHDRAKQLRMQCIRKGMEAEVTYTDSKNRQWRYPVSLVDRTCHCRGWQIRGIPCIHALFFMSVIGGEDGEVDQYVSEYFSVAKFRAAYAMNVPTLLGKDQWMKVDPGFKLYSPVLTRPAGRPRKNRIRASAEGGAPIRKRKCKRCGIPGHIARLCKNGVDPAFGMEDQAGASNAEENEATIQPEEIEAAVQHEDIEAAVQHEEIEAAVQHEEIEAAVQHEEIEPMDREQREQMDVEWLLPMSPEEKEQYDRDCYDTSFAQMAANFEEHIQEEKAQASKKKKNKKEVKRKSHLPLSYFLSYSGGRGGADLTVRAAACGGADLTVRRRGSKSADPLLMKDTKTAAVPTVVIDATNIETIAYNIASTAQIQHSMSEPVDVSLPLPSSDPLLMKDTKTPAVPRVRIDAKTIEAIVYNRAAKPPIQPSADPSLMKYTKTAAVPTVVIDATNIEAIAYNIASTADGADDHPSAARRPGLSCPSVRGRVRRRKLG
ncbi:hypothetical protein QYE76_056216 [Lolium multiflorum]|uniref:Mutator-like transposase n=1 Tax=Lolium multiflorum TaxID=4521 RepID=A0AAD8T1S1_LOLMU|nr:hypothetical protein QYE76_056216 [Lolium multiflorum]